MWSPFNVLRVVVHSKHSTEVSNGWTVHRSSVIIIIINNLELTASII